MIQITHKTTLIRVCGSADHLCKYLCPRRLSVKAVKKLHANQTNSLLGVLASWWLINESCLQTMQTLSTVLLRPGEADRVIAGHPWIYSGSIIRLTAPAEDGALVQVKDHRQRFLGVGFYNTKSKISVRMIAPEKVEIDRSFFVDRIRAALAIRKRHLPKATSFRVVNAESDFLSGLIVDKYADVLVVQISSLAMDQRKQMIVDALIQIFSPRAIVERSEANFRKFEGLEESNCILEGEIEGTVPIELNGLKFDVDIAGGHKTGLYLDQQRNYQLVAELINHGQVLDCFSFMGGFALHCARAGATQVHALDQSVDANTAAEKHAKNNGLADKCSFETVNVFDFLKGQTAVRPHEKVVPKFDGIILDPPSFTRTRSAVPDAMRGYKEIHLRALKLLRPGGTLATFCCSHHVDAEMFEAVILDAAYDARRILRRVASYTQSPDHPVLPAVAETEYLKGYAYELVN
ncbi:MAG: putative SAM-dependent methyltransferase [Verrucomicrobiales bacterium]|nr:putative SAM-dependent methyltransferase [Verrucomicrobiales bacterium]